MTFRWTTQNGRMCLMLTPKTAGDHEIIEKLSQADRLHVSWGEYNHNSHSFTDDESGFWKEPATTLCLSAPIPKVD